MFDFFKQKSVLFGGAILASLGGALYLFLQKTPKEVLKPKKKETPVSPKKSEPIEDTSALDLFIKFMNLRELSQKDQIKALTDGKSDLFHRVFYAESISAQAEEQKVLLNEIVENKSESASDLFAIGKAFQLLGKKDLALPFYLKAAEKGCTFAYSHVGVYYQHGMGIEQDMDEALKYFRLGIKHKDPLCKYLYALLLHQGESVPKDEVNAIKLLQQAAKTGYIPAMQTYAELQLTTNPKESIRIFKELIDKKFSPAMTKFGLCQLQGLGMKKDEVAGLAIIKESAMLGDEQAQEIYASLLSETQPKEAFDALKEFVTARASPSTLFQLGKFYQLGIGVEKNVKYAYKLFETAAEVGSLDALYLLGISLINGIDSDGFKMEKNMGLAQQYLLTAADGGHQGAIGFVTQYFQIAQ